METGGEMTSDAPRKLGRNLKIDGWTDGCLTCAEAADEIDLLTKRVAELEGDAKRYAYVRDELAIGQALSPNDTRYVWKFGLLPGRHETLDAAINAAIELEGKCK